MDRRTVCKSVVAAVAAVSGCVASLTERDVDHALYVDNDGDEAHHLSLRVETDGEAVVDETYTVAGGEERTVARLRDPGEHRVSASVANDSWETDLELPLGDPDRASYTIVEIESEDRVWGHSGGND